MSYHYSSMKVTYQGDSFTNFVSGLGTTKDPSTQMQYVSNYLTRAQLEAAYRSDWVARKVVDIPAYDATREWRMWQAKNQQIEDIEALERKLDIKRKVRMGMTRGRLYGGSALILGVEQGQPQDEINLDALGKDCLKFAHVVNRYEMTPGQLDFDITSKYYGEPKFYTMAATMGGPIITLHPSRVVRFDGAPLPDIRLTGDGWGDSILQHVDDAIKAVGLASGGIAAMINDAKMDVIRIPDLSVNMATPEYKDRLLTRFALANQAKSMVNTLLLDKLEEWQRIQTHFAGLPEVMQMYLMIASGAADIPSTRMLGQSPKGLSATGDSDTRNYYDKIGSDQNTELTPTMERLDEILIRSATGARDPNIHFAWVPLWQMTDSERATRDKTRAEIYQIDVNVGLVSPDVLRKGRENQLVEDGVYPGIEQAINEFEGDDSHMPLTPEEQAAQQQVAQEQRLLLTQQQQGIHDAQPRTMYVYRKVTNASTLKAWAKAQGIDTVLPDMHVTVAFSRTSVDWMRMGQDWTTDAGKLTIPPGGPRAIERFDDSALVLLFSATQLQWRHEDMKRNGASWDYDEYQPHITITHGQLDMNLDAIEPYQGQIDLGPEIFEEIDPEKVMPQEIAA